MNVDVVRPRWFRTAVNSVRAATTAAALTMLVGFGALNLLAAPQPPSGGPEQLGMSARPLDAMMERNRCSLTGFDQSVIPSKAIIRTPQGRTELVSFDHGWAVFSGERAGALVAVCLGRDERGPRTHP